MRVFSLLVLTVVLPVGLLSQPKEKTYRERDAALKLFAEEFVAITPGKGDFPAAFKMGSDDAAAEKPVRTVTMTSNFAIAKFEVTQELYQGVMGNNPAKWKGPRNSVEMVSYKDAEDFCRKATEQMRQLKLLTADEEIRLPSEAEWEYCCRAGTTTPFSFANVKDIAEYCWYKPNSPGNDPPVGSKKGNPWGLHEMHGYVSEWVRDSWNDSYKGAPEDGSARLERDAKQFVIRGGSFKSEAERCRSAAREPQNRDYKDDALGFRCVKARR